MIVSNKNGRTHARIAAGLVAIPLAAISVLGVTTSASATTPPNHRITFCHATGSETNPFVVITTDIAAWYKAHDIHQNDEDILGSDCSGDPYPS